jgi:hypothetical protein
MGSFRVISSKVSSADLHWASADKGVSSGVSVGESANPGPGFDTSMRTVKKVKTAEIMIPTSLEVGAWETVLSSPSVSTGVAPGMAEVKHGSSQLACSVLLHHWTNGCWSS